MKDPLTKEQMRMFYSAASAPTRRYLAFKEIMESGNPLTPDEIRALIKKRPSEYGFLRAYLPKENPISGRRTRRGVTRFVSTRRNSVARRRRRNPDDSFWDEFAEHAGRAFWAEAYIREVEDLDNEESEFYDEDLFRELSPGGGEWLDVTPPTPESALREGEAFTAQARKNVPADVLPLLEDLGAETAGWYAAMGAMGHGVGLFDYDVPHKWVGYWEPGVDVQNDAYDAVREAAADYYGE